MASVKRVADLLRFYGQVPVYASHLSTVPSVTHYVKQEDKVACGSVLFDVIEIPGHTLDHIAYYGQDSLFCGDTLFSAGCGKVFEGTYSQMYHSLQKIFHLPSQTKIYCGHEYTEANLVFAKQVEPSNVLITEKQESVKKMLALSGCSLPSTIYEEKKMNPFFRCDQIEVIQAVEHHAGKKIDQPADVFHYLREWKNKF